MVRLQQLKIQASFRVVKTKTARMQSALMGSYLVPVFVPKSLKYIFVFGVAVVTVRIERQMK